MSSTGKPSRGRLASEILLVLGLSLGASAVYSVVSIVNSATRAESIGSQTTSLNQSMSSRPTFDLIYQVLSVVFDLVPVLLVVFLVWRVARPHLAGLGVDFSRSGRDVLSGVALSLVIGIPGLGIYLGGRALDLTLNVVPAPLDTFWWTVPVLLLSAVRAALTEEVIVVGYLFNRLRLLGWRSWQIIVGTALLRGTYHLYQGVPAFVGNLLMGLLFGWLFARFGRLMPLVIAHFVIDAAVFVGYPLAASTFPALFGG
ncbi:MAG: CPBP family intramembrane metalloprotease [Burkholderiaceae bacterium]|nr:CPBP family intramembrane metalloprotease [Microbacteriaceae bacterium]